MTVLDVGQSIFRIKAGVEIKFMWIRAHIGFDGNELTDKYAKGATRKEEKSVVMKYSKTEVKSIIKSEIKKKWHEEWNGGYKG